MAEAKGICPKCGQPVKWPPCLPDQLRGLCFPHDGTLPSGEPVIVEHEGKRYAICGAKLRGRRKGFRCTNHPSENGRCNLTHGGSATMPGNPELVHGLRSKYRHLLFPTEPLDDAEISSLKENIQILDDRLFEEMRKLKSFSENGTSLTAEHWKEFERLEDRRADFAAKERQREADLNRHLNERQALFLRSNNTEAWRIALSNPKAALTRDQTRIILSTALAILSGEDPGRYQRGSSEMAALPGGAGTVIDV